jgi:hypothetical protein
MVVNGRAAVEQLTTLALRWRENGFSESIFWLAEPDDASHAPLLSENGFQMMGPGAGGQGGTTGAAAAAGDKTSRTRTQPVCAVPRGQFTRQISHALRIAYRMRRGRHTFRADIAPLKLTAIITGQERPDSFLPLLAAAQDLHIPVVLLPTNFLCQPDGGAFTRRRDLRLQTELPLRDAYHQHTVAIWVMNRIVRRFKPQQIFASRFGPMLCYPGNHLVGLWLGGVLTANTWHQGTRFVDRVIVSGDEEGRVCADAGIAADRVIKLGNPVFDALMRNVPLRVAIRHQLEAQLGIDGSRKILVFSVPQMWEHNMLTQAEQFAMVDEVLSVLRAHDGPVVLSLHPKSHPDVYRPSAARFGMPVLQKPLMDIIVAADVFVAGAYSSTIRWALALGLPTANLDFWDLNESTYANQPDYPTVRNASELRRWLDAVERLPWKGPAELSIPARNPLGIQMDGEFSGRLESLIDRFTPERVPN